MNYIEKKSVFDRLFRSWYLEMVYFACYFVKDKETCKDIASDAFEYLWRNYEKIDESTAKSYLLSFIKTGVLTIYANKTRARTMQTLSGSLRDVLPKIQQRTRRCGMKRYKKGWNY